MTNINVFWFRRDLRLEDNHGLCQALQAGLPVLLLFIFDKEILDKLENPYDRRVDYIHQALQHINQQLQPYQATVQVYHGKPHEVFEQLTNSYQIQNIYCNHDYEPQAIARDAQIAQQVKPKNIGFYSYKDQVIFEQNEVLKDDQSPYTVYTPYSKKWLKVLAQNPIVIHPSAEHLGQLWPLKSEMPSLQDLGFLPTDIQFSKPSISAQLVEDYPLKRDFPGIEKGTSRLAMPLRFGTVSIRYLVNFAQNHHPMWLSELIWREFFMQILYHFPHVTRQAFKPAYDGIAWRNNLAEFEAWCAGQTGYPMVDAGMRELNATGHMHNRVRMVVASFLCKHLLIDWRWGEAYFAQKLNDFDLSANNGNWQWAAGCGCDAAPYFRVFNPELQAKKFDQKGQYIAQWVPELQSFDYPKPMVEHAMARDRALLAYKLGLENR
jgi:deoxyribodipyrimidine photo-lyase